MRLVSLRFCCRDALDDMQYDLLGGPRDLDLNSNFDLDLLRPRSMLSEAPRRKKHDGVIPDSLSLLVQKLFVKNDFHKKHDLTSGDLDIDLSEKMTEVNSFGILRSRMPFTASLYLSQG